MWRQVLAGVPTNCQRLRSLVETLNGICSTSLQLLEKLSLKCIVARILAGWFSPGPHIVPPVRNSLGGDFDQDSLDGWGSLLRANLCGTKQFQEPMYVRS